MSNQSLSLQQSHLFLKDKGLTTTTTSRCCQVITTTRTTRFNRILPKTAALANPETLKKRRQRYITRTLVSQWWNRSSRSNWGPSPTLTSNNQNTATTKADPHLLITTMRTLQLSLNNNNKKCYNHDLKRRLINISQGSTTYQLSRTLIMKRSHNIRKIAVVGMRTVSRKDIITVTRTVELMSSKSTVPWIMRKTIKKHLLVDIKRAIAASMKKLIRHHLDRITRKNSNHLHSQFQSLRSNHLHSQE